MRYLKISTLITVAIGCALTLSCREDDEVLQPTIDDTGETNITDYAGLYVLCEGNMGSNKATLDYLDLHTGQYYKNIFPSRNPQQVKELGDVGNDAKIYGSRLWLVINCSNKVEVCTADSALSLGHVDIPNCRFLTFDGASAYVSSYVGQVNGTSVQGSVYRVDTLSLKVTGQVNVGFQPEEMAIVDGKLYVANSGGYIAPQYDRTISVIDLATMCEERQIDVAVNLHRLRLDRYGQLWVSSRGNSRDVPSMLYWLKTDTQGQMQVAGHIDIPVSDMCIVGDSLYFYGADFNAVTYDVTSAQGIIDVQKHVLVNDILSNAPEYQKIRQLYGIIVHPQNRDFYLMDAKNYVSSGELLHFNADGTFDYKVRTGDIPGHATYLYKNKN